MAETQMMIAMGFAIWLSLVILVLMLVHGGAKNEKLQKERER